MIAHRIYRLSIPLRNTPTGRLPQRRNESTTFSRSDYLKILGLNEEASPADIKHAYYQLTLLHHPDRNRDDKHAHTKFMAILEAYERLNDFAISPAERKARLEQERAETWKPNTERMDDIMRNVKIILDGQSRGTVDDPECIASEEVKESNRILGPQIFNAGLVAVGVLGGIVVLKYIESSS